MGGGGVGNGQKPKAATRYFKNTVLPIDILRRLSEGKRIRLFLEKNTFCF
jgi:hypothetical protein